jgi:hypothetical protein
MRDEPEFTRLVRTIRAALNESSAPAATEPVEALAVEGQA